MEALFRAYAATALSHAIRKSDWAFAVIEIAHLIALALLGGVVLIAAVGLAGRRLAFAGRVPLWRGVRTVGIGALIATVGSGILLVGSNPLKYYFSVPFSVKLWLLLAALAASVLLDRTVTATKPHGWAIATLAMAVAALWLAIALAGRAIGLI